MLSKTTRAFLGCGGLLVLLVGVEPAAIFEAFPARRLLSPVSVSHTPQQQFGYHSHPLCFL